MRRTDIFSSRAWRDSSKAPDRSEKTWWIFWLSIFAIILAGLLVR
jgi:hypothetical protein